MPDLARTVDLFATNFYTENGVLVRGQLKAAPSPRIGYEGRLAPRGLLICPASSNGSPGQILLGPAGDRYLTGDWDDHSFGTIPISFGLVLFQITHDLTWTRKAISTVEPISRLVAFSSDVSVGNATIPCVVETINRSRDMNGNEYRLNRILTNVFLQVEDLVGGMRIDNVSSDLGLTYAEAL